MTIDRKKLAREILHHESDANLFDIAEKGIKKYLKEHNITYISKEYIWAVQSVIPQLEQELAISHNKRLAISSIISLIICRKIARKILHKLQNENTEISFKEAMV